MFWCSGFRKKVFSKTSSKKEKDGKAVEKQGDKFHQRLDNLLFVNEYQLVEKRDIELDAKANEKFRNDTHHLLNILPDVAWNIIAKKLPRSQVEILINASPFFRDQLLHKRVLFLFQQVLKALVTNEIGEIFVNGPTWSYQNQSTVCSMISNCRLVCLLWHNAVEKIAQISNPNWKPFPEPDYLKQYVVSNLLRKSYDFSSITKTKDFVDTFGTFDRNPFIGKTITVRLTPIHVADEDLDLYYSIITTLIEALGHHIIHSHFYSCSDITYEDLDRIYDNLRKWLSATPNLHTLDISLFLNSNLCPSRTISSLPKLNCLHSLTLNRLCGLFANATIGNNLHISKLNLNISKYNLRRLDLYHDFDYLERLELTLNSNELEDIIVPFWRCETFKLKLVARCGEGYYTGDISLPLNQIFDLLQSKFCSKVHELDLQIYRRHLLYEADSLFQETLECRLNLGKVRKLNLEVENSCAFDFLLGVRDTLESLTITFKVNRKDWQGYIHSNGAKRKQILLILGFEDQLYGSNIWTLFPKLETVSFNFQDGVDYKYKRRYQPVVKQHN